MARPDGFFTMLKLYASGHSPGLIRLPGLASYRPAGRLSAAPNETIFPRELAVFRWRTKKGQPVRVALLLAEICFDLERVTRAEREGPADDPVAEVIRG